MASRCLEAGKCHIFWIMSTIYHAMQISMDAAGLDPIGLAYFLWKTVPESSAALVLTTSGIVKSDSLPIFPLVALENH